MPTRAVINTHRQIPGTASLPSCENQRTRTRPSPSHRYASMTRPIRAFVLITVMLATTPLMADWEQVRTASRRDDVSTWYKRLPDNPLHAFRGEIEVPYSLLRIMAVLGDISAFPDWVFQCDHAEMHPDEWGLDVARIAIKGIWPVSDRDAVVRTTYTQNPTTLAVVIRSKADHDVLPPLTGYVRLPALDNTFILEPLPDGWTRITFQTFADPGGAIPGWLANFVATRAPLWTLARMYRQMHKPVYDITSVDELPIMFPGIEDLRLPETQ